jgi:hypothetical protein
VTPTKTRTPTQECTGDCNGDLRVATDELVLAVNITLGTRGADECRSLDANDSGAVEIDELIAAVSSALGSCLPIPPD